MVTPMYVGTKALPVSAGSGPLGAVAPCLLFCALPVRGVGDIYNSVRCHGTQALLVNVRVIRRQSETCCWLIHYRDAWRRVEKCCHIEGMRCRATPPRAAGCARQISRGGPFVVYSSFSEQADEHEDSHDSAFVGTTWSGFVLFLLLRPIDVGHTLTMYDRGVSCRFPLVCSATRLVPRPGLIMNKEIGTI